MALLYLFHQNSRFGGLAYDDFSELDFDREVESAQQPKMVSLFTLFMGIFLVSGFLCSVLEELEL